MRQALRDGGAASCEERHAAGREAEEGSAAQRVVENARGDKEDARCEGEMEPETETDTPTTRRTYRPPRCRRTRC